MGLQARADMLDAEMLSRGLPEDAVVALSAWRAGPGDAYARGVDSHSIAYAPAAWAAIGMWPAQLASQKTSGMARVSRSGVQKAALLAAQGSSTWTEAFIASYVWGQGRNGYGPHRLGKILASGAVEPVFRAAVGALADDGAAAAYRSLDGAITGLGAAFFTKFLYFAGTVVLSRDGTAPLILDKRLALALRGHAANVARDLNLEDPEALAKWLWSDGGWTPHRYGVYLAWMHAAAKQLETAADWPPGSDLLELALFSGAWDPHPAS